jgi:hypothetical protein
MKLPNLHKSLNLIVCALLLGCSAEPQRVETKASEYAVGVAPVCTHWAAQTRIGRQYDIVLHSWNCDRGPRCRYYTMGLKVEENE